MTNKKNKNKLILMNFWNDDSDERRRRWNPPYGGPCCPRPYPPYPRGCLRP